MSRCLLAVLLLAFTTEAWPAHAAENGLQEYLVVGTVVWANPGSSSIAIRGTSLVGRLHLQVKSFRVKQPGALVGLHPGDRITAEFSEKDGMLHRLRRILRRNPS